MLFGWHGATIAALSSLCAAPAIGVKHTADNDVLTGADAYSSARYAGVIDAVLLDERPTATKSAVDASANAKPWSGAPPNPWAITVPRLPRRGLVWLRRRVYQPSPPARKARAPRNKWPRFSSAIAAAGRGYSSRLWAGETACVRANECVCDTGRPSHFYGFCMPSTLILDGMPFGQGLIDAHDASRARMLGGPRNKLVYRLEQGIGRAVRSPADYALIILAGPELASYVSNADVRPFFGRDLQLQLAVTQELADQARNERASSPQDAFNELAKQLLLRDPNWRAYYDDRVRQQLAGGHASLDSNAVRAATREREGFARADAGDLAGASSCLTDAINLADTDHRRAGLLEQKARYTQASDPGEAVKLQAAAFDWSRAVFRPPMGASAKPPRHVDAAARVLALARKYTDRNGLIAAFAALRAEMSFSLPHSRFELLLQETGRYLGADSTRPEHETGHGPDNLMLWSDLSLVVEAKNMAKYAVIPKTDASQLLHSMKWFQSTYPNASNAVPVFVGPSARVDGGVCTPEGTRIITPEHLDKLLEAISLFLGGVAGRALEQWTIGELNQLLVSHGLNSG
jgi:hypothetical protein